MKPQRICYASPGAVFPQGVVKARSQVYLVEIYNEMFRYQVSIGLLPLILIISANEVELLRLQI